MATRRNDPCPCGSGKKYKRCCLSRDKIEQLAPSQKDRDLAVDISREFTMRYFPDECDLAREEFYGEIPEDWDLDDYQMATVEEAFWGWFLYDRPLSDGESLAREILDSGGRLPDGTRRYLEGMSKTVMQPWEVFDVIPGKSIDLLQKIDGTKVIVRERTASRTLKNGDFVAARINPLGPSGGAEMDGGFFAFPAMAGRPVEEQLRARFDDFRRGQRRANDVEFYARTPVFFARAWLNAFFERSIPDVMMPTGEYVSLTTVTFDLKGDRDVAEALEAHPDIEPVGPGQWTRTTILEDGRRFPEADIELEAGVLRLVALSTQAAERGRALLEELLAGDVEHRHTVAESPSAVLERGVERPDAVDIDPALLDAMKQEYYENYYRKWLDEEIPALDGMTPREAARMPELRKETESLIRGLEGMYQESLRTGEVAYDPSWMWAELALVDEGEEKTPPNAADRWAEEYQWDEELAEIAEAIRERPSFDEREPVTLDEVRTDLSARRLLNELESREEDVLRAAINHEVHRRRTFWVSRSLAFMLQQTETDIVGRDLGLPFASFALVFTDRATLALGERHLAGSDSPMAGHILRVLTVFVRGTASEPTGERTIELDFAFDHLGEGVPGVSPQTLRVREDDLIFADSDDEPVTFEMGENEFRVDPREPLETLTRIVVNSILYATSAGVEPEPRPAAREPFRSDGSKKSSESSSVFYLPGKISISHIRNIEKLERGQGGGQLMHRFMVRGHWRRANPSWKDQRMRWIEPYWKGPELATIIERQYEVGE